MERASSQRKLRAERLGRSSPYARPDRKGQKAASSAPFATIKSIYNYFTSPFTHSDSHSSLPTQVSTIDQKSEDGSEDGWNGDAPGLMDGQNVFDLAAAAGRDGEAFEDRAAEWRARDEKIGGRREVARRGVEPTSTTSMLKSPTMPGHLLGYKASPSLPSLTITNTLKRSHSPPRLPPRSPLPSFLPPTSRPAPSVSSVASESASSAALAAFLEAKKGQQMTADDFRVIETLTANMKSETVAGSPKRSEFRTGGWSAGKSAGTFTSTPRSMRPLRGANGFESNDSTPARPSSTFGTPGATFSVGSNTSYPDPSATNPRRITYLGPGMSPRRMLSNTKSPVKPLLDFNFSREESTPKKRRVHDFQMEVNGDEEGNGSELSMSNGISSNTSMPNLGSFTQNGSTASEVRLREGHATSSKPSPLSQQDTSSPRREAVAAGKKRAADIMRELIDEEIGTIEETRQPDYMVINPYDTESAASSPGPSPSSPRSPIRAGTPRKSILRSSLRGKETPLRGAAAKMEIHRSGRKLTTLEILQGKRPWTEPEMSTPTRKNEGNVKSVRIETPERENDEMEIDAYFDKTPSQTPTTHLSRPKAPSRSPSLIPEQSRRAKKISSPEPFASFDVPMLNTSSQPIPSYKPASGYSQSFPSPSQESALASAQKKTGPKFTPSPLSTSITPLDDDEPLGPRRSDTSTAKRSTNPNAIYLSARDSALKVDKPVLPFFTFTLPNPPSTPSEAVRSAATKRSIETFTFILPPLEPLSGTAQPFSEAKEWTCSFCMLKNPPTETEKCTVCEAPKPSSDQPTSKTANGLMGMLQKAGPRGDDEWTCGLCMLQNPGSAKEKCLICEAKRS